MTLKEFKLTVLALDEFSDEEIEKLLYSVELENIGNKEYTSEVIIEHIIEAIRMVAVHRPQLYKNLIEKYA